MWGIVRGLELYSYIEIGQFPKNGIIRYIREENDIKRY